NPQPDPHLHKPWLRSYFVLNAADGTELTYDSDHTGNPEYAPIVAFGTNSGSAYPPVSEPDGLLYFNNLWRRDNQGKVMGWRIGTPYVTLEGAQGDTGEPQSISGGGSLIYRAICCDRAGDWFDLNDLTTKGLAWFYNTPLTDQAPGYDQMWWFIDPTILDRLTGTYGTKNGIYNNHGDQNPIVPYNGMLFSHRSNAVIAYGPAPGPGKLPLLTASSPPAAAMTTPSTADLTGRLDAEIQKMIAAGRLRPGYYNAGQFNIYPDLVDYFANPGDTLYTLAAAYPLVSPSLQPQLRDYLHMEFSRYFDPTMVANTGWADGAAREAYALPPEVTADLANYPQQLTAGTAWSWQYPQVNFYAMWKFEQVFPEEAGNVYQLAKSVLEVPVPALATDSYLTLKPWELNGYIDGYVGFLRLQEAAGQGSADAALRAQVTAELQRLELLRASTFSKDTPYVTYDQGYTHRTLNVARNFIMLTPDLGNYLRSTVLSKVQAAISEYNDVGPYWFVARYTAAIGEGGTQNLYDYNSMFLAKAYILKQSRADLTRYLDVPGFARGDLLYIQDLIAALQAS
ncbi:MAG TPA: hypothetical protein VF813_02490, partial [Anaerolineaceae bacterium]